VRAGKSETNSREEHFTPSQEGLKPNHESLCDQSQWASSDALRPRQGPQTAA